MKPGLYFCQPWRSSEGWRIAYVQYPGRQYSTYEGHLIIAPPPNTTMPLKQTPLPSTFKWKDTENFEDFHDAFISYMVQQCHSQYIYQENFISIYL